ncbi:MAG: sulfur carrier protein ThiS [Oscillospiraceae bacterium]|nr:sulfur carrier protein ThiS [Oscillospiraceae bacterium]
MIVKINGKEENIKKGTSILSLLDLKGVNPNSVVIEHNYEIPERGKWGEILVSDGDNIEIVKFMGGG